MTPKNRKSDAVLHRAQHTYIQRMYKTKKMRCQHLRVN